MYYLLENACDEQMNLSKSTAALTKWIRNIKTVLKSIYCLIWSFPNFGHTHHSNSKAQTGSPAPNISTIFIGKSSPDELV